jgi:DNA invertase Pin-like site-specific DNA recombinase
MQGTFVAYYRVSTDRQGRSDYLSGGGPIIAEFTEIETGKRNDRPELGRALAACRRHKAKLVIAKLDRLSRNLAFIATLLDAGAEFVAVDNPNANKLTLHILAAVAQHEREMIGERTKAALQAARARGIRLGRNAAERLAPANRQAAMDRASQLAPIFLDMQAAGLTARKMAAELQARNIPTPTGAKWHAQTVLRALARIGLHQAGCDYTR